MLRKAFEKRSLTVVPYDQWRTNNGILSGVATPSGVTVTPDSVLTLTAAYAAIRIKAYTLASLPLLTYQKTSNGKQRAITLPLFSILRDSPNPEMSSFDMWAALYSHVLIRGNGYGLIDYDSKGTIQALWPLRPDRMNIIRDPTSGELVYRYQVPGISGEGEQTLRPEQVMHLRGLSSDGLYGYSPVASMRNAIGLAKAQEEYGGRFFSNDARPGLILSNPNKMSDPAYNRLRDSFEASHMGLENAHRIAILEEGTTATPISFNNADAQFLQSRQFSIAEIARIFAVPPHLLFDLERATFSNIEQQSIEFVVYHLRPDMVNFEQKIKHSLFLQRERDAGYYSEWMTDGLLRGDTASRSTAYATGHQNGWLSINEIRQRENMDTIPGGDAHYIGLNMAPVDDKGAPIVVPGQPAPKQGSEPNTPRRDMKPFVEDVVGRIARREQHDVEDAVRKLKGESEKSMNWISRFYKDDHPGYMRRMLQPFVDSQQMASEQMDGIIEQYCARRMTNYTSEVPNVELSNAIYIQIAAKEN